MSEIKSSGSQDLTSAAGAIFGSLYHDIYILITVTFQCLRPYGFK